MPYSNPTAHLLFVSVLKMTIETFTQYDHRILILSLENGMETAAVITQSHHQSIELPVGSLLDARQV